MAYNQDTKLRGNTNNTLIGNNGDKLKIDGSEVTQPVSGTVTTLGAAEQKNTYSAATYAIIPGTLHTDLITIVGSETKIIKVLNITVSGMQTTAGSVIVSLLRRSSSNSGGTTVPIYPVLRDSTNPAATAVLKAYTAKPSSVGTLIGMVAVRRLYLPAGILGQQELFHVDFSRDFGQPLTLRGDDEVLAVNLASATIVGGSFVFNITWTEE